MNRTVADAAEAMEQHAETAGLTLRTELTTETVFIEGDVFALGRVYRNLILNAIQATAPGGLIVVATEAQAERVQVRIYDTGCGIPPERLGQVFEDFVTTKRRGLGLGLAISKKIVEQLGGQITVASEVGKGTTFVLDFPRTRRRTGQMLVSQGGHVRNCKRPDRRRRPYRAFRMRRRGARSAARFSTRDRYLDDDS